MQKSGNYNFIRNELRLPKIGLKGEKIAQYQSANLIRKKLKQSRAARNFNRISEYGNWNRTEISIAIKQNEHALYKLEDTKRHTKSFQFQFQRGIKIVFGLRKEPLNNVGILCEESKQSDHYNYEIAQFVDDSRKNLLWNRTAQIRNQFGHHFSVVLFFFSIS